MLSYLEVSAFVSVSISRMDVSKLSIGFIGGGMMAEAIAKGLLEKSVLRRDQVRISEPYPPRKEYLVKEGWTLMETNAALVEWADVVFLAVKPNVIHTVKEGQWFVGNRGGD